MNLTVSNISKLSGVARKTVYRALRGGATQESLVRIQNAICKITGKKISVNEISMGKYSTNKIVNKLCNEITYKKKRSTNVINRCVLNNYDSSFSCSMDVFPDSYSSVSDFRILI